MANWLADGSTGWSSISILWKMKTEDGNLSSVLCEGHCWPTHNVFQRVSRQYKLLSFSSSARHLSIVLCKLTDIILFRIGFKSIKFLIKSRLSSADTSYDSVDVWCQSSEFPKCPITVMQWPVVAGCCSEYNYRFM